MKIVCVLSKIEDDRVVVRPLDTAKFHAANVRKLIKMGFPAADAGLIYNRIVLGRIQATPDGFRPTFYVEDDLV